MLKKYTDCCGQSYEYSKKETLISDLCQHLQMLKKEYGEAKKTNPRTPERNFKGILSINTSDGREEWCMSISVGEQLTINTLVLRLNENHISYFGEELKRTPTDTSYNKCRNITEFRGFLKGEVGITNG